MAKPSFVPLVFAFLFLSSQTFCSAHDDNEVDDESKFTYLLGTNEGPENWGNLKAEWKLCTTGKFQSPVNIRNKTVTVTTALQHLKPNYKIAPAIIINRGHDIKLQWEGDAGYISVGGTEYKLQQCHWHTPSEHKLNNKCFAMEAHMVHQSADGKIAVVAIPFKIGSPNPFFEELMRNIETVDDKGLKLGMVDPQQLGIGDEPFYRYIGSLTVPPCTEGITWTVLHKARTVSMEQLMAYRSAVHDGFEANARPVQSLHKRPVYLAI
ncbi:PREDICTED: alpha carbonic anhydrase 4-like [Nicotiana attenuata]|uniref:Carbonic anhydrase n=1 Tax=Nicotiana attenuata TaxID=49451 RepID=A0A314LFC4_NICAT|nr:PREDICTED: alpha carbonic anhydrase 4-like [Nicotiana attenuata]OIT40378.1 alpha carbonic anhydrase 4 [Nicotiana attenuata]